MINAELGHVTTLREFYTEIRSQQEAAHGDDYCAQHDALMRLFNKEGCISYKEIGTHQGGTAAAVMQTCVSYMELVDIDMGKYRKFLAPIASQYCKDNDIELVVKETSSLGLGAIGKVCDVILIDSVHKRPHMEKELEMHAQFAKRYIVFHDTSAVPALYAGIVEFCRLNPFEIIERGTENVGYTVIKRK